MYFYGYRQYQRHAFINKLNYINYTIYKHSMYAWQQCDSCGHCYAVAHLICTKHKKTVTDL